MIRSITVALLCLLLVGCAITPADKIRLDDGRLIARPMMKPTPALPDRVRAIGIRRGDNRNRLAEDVFANQSYDELNTILTRHGPLTTPPSLTQLIRAYLTQPTTPPGGQLATADHLKWLTWRMTALEKLGMPQAAVDLYLTAPDRLADEQLVITAMNNMARTGQIQAACLEPMVHLRQLQSNLAQQIFEICRWVINPDYSPFLVRGDMNGAISALAKDIRNNTRKARVTPDIPAFLRHVMLHNGYPMPDDMITDLPAADLIGILMDDEIDTRYRRGAAQKLYKNGYGLPDRRAVMAALSVLPDEYAADFTALRRVTGTNNPIEQAANLIPSFEQIADHDGPWMAAGIKQLGIVAKSIPVHDNFVDQAGIISLLHYYIGDTVGAGQWINQMNAPSDKDTDEKSGVNNKNDTKYKVLAKNIDQLLHSPEKKNNPFFHDYFNSKQNTFPTDDLSFHRDENTIKTPFHSVMAVVDAWSDRYRQSADDQFPERLFTALAQIDNDSRGEILLDILILKSQYRN